MSDKVQNLRPFHDLGDFIRTKPLSRSVECINSKTKYIHYGDIHGKYNGFVNDKSNIPYIEDINDFDFLSEGDLVFADASEDYIDLGKTILIENIDCGRIISGLHTHAFRPNFDFVNPTYLKYYTESEQYKREMTKRGQGISVLGISKKELMKIEANFHAREFQDKYAMGLRNIDFKINLIEEKIESLKLFKRGYIQNEIINKKFDNCCILTEVLKERKEYATKNSAYIHCSLSKDGINPKRQNENRDFLVRNEDKKYKVTKLDDICYNPANLKFGVICKNTFGEGIFSPIYITFTVKKNFDVDFIETLITNKNIINKMRKYEEGTVYERMAVKPEDLLKTKIYYPNLKKQVEISKKLKIIDEKIFNTECKLKALKEFKKGLLQQMFV